MNYNRLNLRFNKFKNIVKGNIATNLGRLKMECVATNLGQVSLYPQDA